MNKKPLRINAVNLLDDGHRLEFTIEIDAKIYPIYFYSKDARFIKSTEALIATALLPAMRLNANIEIEGEISQSFSSCLSDIQSIYQQWNPHLKMAEISFEKINIRKHQIEKSSRVASFFSGGIDAYYTFLKNQKKIDDIIFIRGFDIPLNNDFLIGSSSKQIRGIGVEFNKRVIEVETNVRSFLQQFSSLQMYYGAVLASISHMLSDEFGKIYIGSHDTYGKLTTTYGSHPVLDPLWSSENMEIIHDGCEASRLEKTRFVSNSEFALNNLRVCFANSQSVLNCGVCEKCLRTMLGLLAVGSIEKCGSFENPIAVKNIKQIFLNPYKRASYSDILFELEKESKNRKICYEISKLLNRPHFVRTNIGLLKNYMKREKYRFPNVYDMLRK
ncbi:MAG: hypothetical protein K9J12_11930 [Melioribacteraceae bacterium]|nr:hypothetical protein [Melioribacteraceae bacterium]MCF8262892.1 hypothetical protein [Melioribacteraceae bacterium]MCF8430914.1 hypothetical protein [Melioribacteraceae bacterium]